MSLLTLLKQSTPVPYVMGHNTSATASVVVTLTAPLRAGDSVVVFCSGAITSSATDSRGNSYTVFSASTTNRPVAFAYSIRPANALIAGDTVTVTFSAANNVRASVVGVTGVLNVDKTPAGNGSASGTAPSAATGVLSNQNEICLGIICCGGTNNPGSLSWNLIEYNSTGPVMTCAYKMPGATTASQTFSATISAATAYDIGVMTFNPLGVTTGISGSSSSGSSASGALTQVLRPRAAAIVTTGAGALTLAVPAQPVAVGDLIVIWASCGFASMTWTSVPGDNLVAQTAISGNTMSSQCFSKIADASDVAKAASSGSYVLTISASHCFNAAIAVIPVSSTAHPFDPSDTPGSGQTNAAALAVTAPSITTAVSGDMLLWLGSVRAASGGVPQAITLPAGYTVPSGVSQANSSGAGTANVGILMGYTTQVAAGATGAVAGSIGVANVNSGLLLGIKAVPVAPLPGVVNHIVVGAPTSSSFQVIARTSGATSCRLAYSTSASMTSPSYISAQTPDSAGYVRFTVPSLSASTRYYVQVADTPTGGSETLIGSVGSCKTLPAAGSPANFTVAFGSCLNANAPTTPALDAAVTDWNNYSADLNINTGDFNYSGTTSTDLATQRGTFESQITGYPSLSAMVSNDWGYYCRSDHEAGPDNGDSNNAYTQVNIQAAQQVFPFGTLGDTTNTPPHGLYQAWVVGRVRFIMLDIRNVDRSPGGNTDDSSKTMLGAAQLAWLQNQLIQPELLKVIISDVGWMGAASITNGPDKWWSYDTERQAILSYIAANASSVNKVMLWHGDTHAVGYADSATNTWGGFPVWCAAPIANDGGGRNLTAFTSYYNNAGGQCRLYGRVAFTDDGTTITAAFQGWDGTTGTAQVSRTETFSLASGATLSISGTAAGASSASATLGLNAIASGTASSASIANGAVVLTIAISGSAPSASSTSGAISALAALSGSAPSVSSASGAVVIKAVISGSAPSVSNASGVMGLMSLVSGVATTVSTGAGTVVMTVVVAGSSANASSASGTLGLRSPLAGQSATTSSASGTLNMTAIVAGSSIGTSTASGSLSRVSPLAGSAVSASSATGAVAIQSGAITWPVAGTAPAQSAASGTVSSLVVLTGTSPSTSLATGVLGMQGVLVGSAVAASGATGSVKLVAAVSGSAASVSIGTGSISLTGVVSGSALSTSAATGWALGGPLAGSAISHSLASGAIARSIVISGYSSTGSSGTGWTVGGPIAGSAHAVSSAFGALGLKRALSGVASTTSHANGSVIILSRVFISGSASTGSHAAGSLFVLGALSGVSRTGSAGLGRVSVVLGISAKAATASHAEGWLKPAFVIGGLPDKLTALVYVSNSLTAGVSVSTSRATIYTNKISAEVT